jgi:tartrate-resistant acid phosphatase type 5
MPSRSNPVTRRRALQQTFFFSAALALGARTADVRAEDVASGERHFLMIGDWGAGGSRQAQSAVAAAMIHYIGSLAIKPDGLFLVGDNFYGKLTGGTACPRWKTDFEDMYPASAFPGPCWAMLGNHDYYAEPAGKFQAQLDYAAARPGTRWTMPAKWYRLDWPAVDPLITCLVLDTNYKASSYYSEVMSPHERVAQRAWLQTELAKPRTAPWLICMGHHPLYSNGKHGDSRTLIAELGSLFQKHGVDFYFSGHDHDLQHFQFAGLRTSFVVSGGGGARLYEIEKARHGPYSAAVYGFTHLQVSREKFIVRHLDPNRKQVHAFSRTLEGKIEILS